MNHAVNKETQHHELLLGMEHRLLKMMDFTLIFVVVTGTTYLYFVSAGFSSGYLKQGWFHAKLTLVAALAAYHFWCRKIHNDFKQGRENHSHVWFRWFNEMPVFILLGVLYLVVTKPF